MFSDDASGKREREREREREKKIAKRNVNENAPIIQNAVKTPTPPHCANCFTFATVGTMSTFDAAQCWRGMKDLSTSLMCVSFVYLIRVILRLSCESFEGNFSPTFRVSVNDAKP